MPPCEATPLQVIYSHAPRLPSFHVKYLLTINLHVNMPFLFSSLCDLLNKLDKNRTKPSSTDKIQDRNARTVVAWFSKHNGIIPRRGPEAIAFLSYLFPERRPDRVFSLQVKTP